MTNEQSKLVKVEDLKVIDLPKFDPTPFIGVKAMVDEIEPKSKIHDGKESHYLQFKALVSPDGFNGEPLYATRNVGFQIDENGVMGWGENTIMAKFLLANKVKSPMEMKGKTIIVQSQKDSTYLTF